MPVLLIIKLGALAEDPAVLEPGEGTTVARGSNRC